MRGKKRGMTRSPPGVHQGPVKEEPRLPPVAEHRALRDPAQLGDLGERKAAEEMQVPQLPGQGLGQFDAGAGDMELSAQLLGPAAARIVPEQA